MNNLIELKKNYFNSLVKLAIFSVSRSECSVSFEALVFISVNEYSFLYYQRFIINVLFSIEERTSFKCIRIEQKS
jgi:hypothetical protein